MRVEGDGLVAQTGRSERKKKERVETLGATGPSTVVRTDLEDSLCKGEPPVKEPPVKGCLL